ncbi:unnamed protein product [Schistosoma rodhaini]|uniref:WW domain-containing protein n=1 Tax=Schistosoma rodhaini TaxID=6188 RepID=A0AA85GHG7_9TREM|nr:unnamed protein product [Schistosoma rodhaini]
MLKAVLLEESAIDEPTEDEVMLYAESLGIDVEKEQDLLYIAKEGISAHLPNGWQVLKDENNQIFYYDTASGISLWEHPLDRHFRDCVVKARQKKQDAIDTTSSPDRIPHDKSVEAGCIVSNSSSRPLPKPSTNNKEAPKGYTPTRSSPHEGKLNTNTSKKLTEKHGNNSQLSTSALAEPRFQCPVVTTKDDDHLPVTDDPTEYLEIKLSRNKTHEKSLVNNHEKLQLSSRKDHLSSEGFKYWSEMYKENLRQADENLTVLQSKIRESLLLTSSHKKTNSILCNNATPNSLSKYNPTTITKDSHIVSNLSRCFSSSDLLNIVDNNQTYCKRLEILSSPVKKIKNTFNDDILCPEVGISPTAVIQTELSNRKDKYVGHGVSPVNANSKLSSSILQENMKNSTYQFTPDRTRLTEQNASLEKSTDGIQEDQSNVKLKPNKSLINISECISHLVEERSRVQGKLFRLKLLYKTYKRRLDNLDASLSALQEQTNAEQSSNVLPVSKLYKQNNNTKNVQEKINPSVFTNSTNENDRNVPLLPQDSIVTTCVTDLNESVNHRLHSRLSYCHHHHYSHQNPNVLRIKRSVSVPRSPISCNYLRNTNNPHISSHHLHDSTSVSRDLAVSLASIDVQLHNVLKHLDSNTDESLQSHINHYIQNHYPISGITDEQHHYTNEDTNVGHIQHCLENINLSNEPLHEAGCSGGGSCMSNNLTYSPSCSCNKTPSLSYKTVDLLHSPVNCSPNSNLDFTSNRRNSICTSRFMKSAHKPVKSVL